MAMNAVVSLIGSSLQGRRLLVKIADVGLKKRRGNTGLANSFYLL